MNIFLFAEFTLSAQDFEVAPVLVSFDANPGETQSQTLHIRNHSNERQKFTLALNDYIINEKGAKQAAEAGSTNRSLASWLNINPSFLELNPNESAEVQLTLNVPQNGFSTRWGMIPVEVAREQSPSGVDKQLATGILLVPRILVLVKQSPRSNQNYSGTVNDLKEISKPDKNIRTFEATLVNTGDKVINAKCFLAVANIETMEEEQQPPQNFTLYPGETRKVQLSLKNELAPGQYAIAFLMDYGHKSAIEGAQMLINVE